MKVCGVEIKGNDAVICIMSKQMGLYDIPKTRVAKISVGDAGDPEEMRKFQFTFAKFLEDYQVEKVVIKGRALKGKFSGGAIGFKLEAAIQLIADLDVEILASALIKKTMERSQVAIDFRDTGLKTYQQVAFETVFTSFERRD
ncbi:DUF3010 family protein [Thalassotalea eurytherma]|uniref:DUF3010 family protein n=1 Tax=Thalassotalea eurytherma TaxID=1144278 RepID=A0ABQ6H613_9GAMM|nr:DUF3010 family protein [Thalassotalea eurytherma]GLX83593.1 hypothetical protein theurythT_30460 [Thalassotalea eurytherma]